MTATTAQRMSPAEGTPPARDLPSGPVSASELEDALVHLDQLDTSNLRIRWRELFGRNAPARLGADLLRRAVTYRLQELVFGGLSRQAQLRLKAAGQQSGKNGPAQGAVPSATVIKPGTRFVREWQGEVHEVQAIVTGDFVYRGKTYRSLSVVARAITGTHQSGPRFFGLRRNDSAASTLEGSNG